MRLPVSESNESLSHVYAQGPPSSSADMQFTIYYNMRQASHPREVEVRLVVATESVIEHLRRAHSACLLITSEFL